MAEAPIRIKLSRAKGWRMPPNTVKVDRSTRWGNPFLVGRDGTRTECVALLRHLMGGLVCLTCEASIQEQEAALRHTRANISALRGKNLACWCSSSGPCHADVLLEIANSRQEAA